MITGVNAMMRILSLLGMLCVLNVPAQAAPFSPTLLKLSAPSVVQYAFNGQNLSLPMTVSGTPANVVFLVFTKDKASSIRKVTNGYLGWHYMNNIDTCMYLSPPVQFQPGARTVVWNGKDKDGNQTPPGEYTYYLWGYDNYSEKTPVSRQIDFQWQERAFVQTQGEGGIPLNQPVIWTAPIRRGGDYPPRPDDDLKIRKKWIIGGDPDDSGWVETCSYMSWVENSAMALDPRNNRMFYFQSMRPDSTIALRKMQWVANGAAILQTEWGSGGTASYPTMMSDNDPFYSGPISDGGDYLFCTDADSRGNGLGTEARIMYVDINTGEVSRKLDVSNWWTNPDDGARGGQTTGGPANLAFLHGSLAANCMSSCIDQMIDPYSVSDDEATLWVNRNGDYIGDRNFDPNAEHPWVCNDWDAVPYKYSISLDDNLFSAFPCYDMGAVSFGLYGPDGTGIGYFAFAGVATGIKWGNRFVDYNSAYDGIYTDNANTDTKGWWFVAHDSIKGTITSTAIYIWLSSPDGGEVWETGTSHIITWQSSGVEKVKIEYSDDNGVSWNLLANDVNAATGSYSWTPAGIQSDKCLVRVTSVFDTSVKGISSAPFTITPPYVKLTAPNGGEVWETGTSQTISWTYQGVGNIKIELSSDDGATWTQIAFSVAASQKSFSLQAPGTVSDRCLVRVSDTANASISDMSDAAFRIEESFIRVSAPNGGEKWESGQTMTIAWSASSGIANVRIDFSSDNGTTWRTITDKTAASEGSFSWKAPNLSSPQCLVRVSDVMNTSLSDRSDGTFTITLSDSEWNVYTTSDGLASNTVSALAVDENNGVWCGSRGEGASYFDGITWKVYNTANSGIVSNDLLWINVDKNNVVWFGATWDGISSFDGVNWKTYSNFSSIRDIYVDANNVKWITSFGFGLARFDGENWTYYKTSNGLHSNNCEHVITDFNGNLWVSYTGDGVSKFDGKTWTFYNSSNGLVNSNIMAMSIDLDGVVWFGTSGGVSSFDGVKWKSYYAKDGLVSNYVHAIQVDKNNVKWFGGFDGVGSFDGVVWKKYTSQNSLLANNEVQRILVDNSNVKWFAHYGQGVTSFRDYTGPYVRVTSPKGGELWESGSTHEITWVSKDVDRIRIEYSLDTSSTWNVLAGNVDASLKSYSWTLPQVQSSSCKVRLTDISDEKHTDTSITAFTISSPFVQITAPNGGERWASGNTHNITWTALGASRVKLEYSPDEGVSWQVIGIVDATQRLFSWTVPDSASEHYQVRISSANDTALTDVSDSVFTVLKNYLRLISPNGGEKYTAEEMVLISWDAASTISFILLEYSPDNGKNWIYISGNIPASDTGYSWEIPYYNSGSFLIRARDEESSGLSDISDKVFSVSSPLSVWEKIPVEFTVLPNSPNPFNPATTISFIIPRAERVKVDVYNLSGQRVGTLLDIYLGPGKHSATWDAKGLSAGMYLGLVRAGTEVKTIKMLFLK